MANQVDKTIETDIETEDIQVNVGAFDKEQLPIL